MMQTMVQQVDQVRKFLRGWFQEGHAELSARATAPPGGHLTHFGVCFGTVPTEGGGWETLSALEEAIEDWAIFLNVNTTPVDDAHPDAPWGDNLVRKLMVIRGSLGVR